MSASRRPGVGFNRRIGHRGYWPLPRADALDLFSGGTFSRSTEGATIIGPATDGSTAFMQWDGVNVRRIEYAPNLPGGYGLLMEGSRTNGIANNRVATGAGWAGGASSTPTSGQAGVDATAVAARQQVNSGGYGAYASIAGVSAGLATSFSVYQRTPTGDPSWQFSSGPLVATGGSTLTSVYLRTEMQHPTAHGGSLVPTDGRDQTAIGGIAAQAHDIISDLHQAETGYFPSSPIRTAGTSATRGADALTYAVGQYPAGFLSSGFRFAFAPLFSSAECYSSGATMVLFGMNGTISQLDIRPGTAAGTSRFAVYLNSGIQFTSADFTHSRNQVMTVEFRPNQGTLLLSGATTGNGLSSGLTFTWPTEVLHVGHRGFGNNVFARFGRYVEVL